MFVPGLRWGNVIDHFLNDHLLNVDIKAHETDKTESLQKFLIFLICILESPGSQSQYLLQGQKPALMPQPDPAYPEA